MFVTSGARDALRFRRREGFAEQYVRPLVAEARKLGLGTAELQDMIDALSHASTVDPMTTEVRR
jgi:DNA-binding transcriptional regulator YhcF (GntR family)